MVGFFKTNLININWKKAEYMNFPELPLLD